VVSSKIRLFQRRNPQRLNKAHHSRATRRRNEFCAIVIFEKQFTAVVFFISHARVESVLWKLGQIKSDHRAIAKNIVVRTPAKAFSHGLLEVEMPYASCTLPTRPSR
jgi:hypothetical protein